MISWAAWRAQPPAPSFSPLTDLLKALPAERWPTPADWSRLATRMDLRNARGLPLRFVADSGTRLSALEFERRIFEQGEVETRGENWHDAFHACAWALFPRSKARINALHVEAGAAGAPNGRSPLRDLLTLFDESGVVIACADAQLAGLLANFQWHELFWVQRERVRREMDFMIFGHALYEHSHALYDGVTGKGVVIPVAADYFSWDPAQRLAHLDAALLQYFAAPHHLGGPRALQPLPLKGIPGWAAENENPGYYRDERQFRPGRMRDRAGGPA
ncbi:MAG: hypothetical protein JWN73_846 [Betaproteobacteria bacterium]|nr:hypothetical protein [Betaproteobacteria bacterium]